MATNIPGFLTAAVGEGYEILEEQNGDRILVALDRNGHHGLTKKMTKRSVLDWVKFFAGGCEYAISCVLYEQGHHEKEEENV